MMKEKLDLAEKLNERLQSQNTEMGRRVEHLESKVQQLPPPPEPLSIISSPAPTTPKHSPPSAPTGLVKARVVQFQAEINMRKSKARPSTKSPADSEGKVVLYSTSLRGVRKTFDDCCRTRVMLNGYGVKVDERDVSLHQRFRQELDEVLNGGGWSLPRVFVEGKHLGGAEDVQLLHDTGELEMMLQGCPRVQHGALPCLRCGDFKFVHCHTCSGSCKVFCEGDGVFQRCPLCNENGIIRCPQRKNKMAKSYSYC